MDFLQCAMERKEGDAKETLVSWLPQKFAQQGRVLKLQNRESKIWTDGWIVKSVNKHMPLDEEIVVKRSMAHTKQRGVSDI